MKSLRIENEKRVKKDKNSVQGSERKAQFKRIVGDERTDTGFWMLVKIPLPWREGLGEGK